MKKKIEIIGWLPKDVFKNKFVQEKYNNTERRFYLIKRMCIRKRNPKYEDFMKVKVIITPSPDSKKDVSKK